MSMLIPCSLTACLRTLVALGMIVSLLSFPSATTLADGDKRMNDQRETVKERLLEVFDRCKAGEHDKAAAYFVYRGPDKSREWKDVLRASNPQERKAVERYCERIIRYLDASTGYDFGEFKVERESEGEWNVWEFILKHGDRSKKVYFAFLKIKGKYAIGDIDLEAEN